MTEQSDRRLRWGIRVQKRAEPRSGGTPPGAVESPQMPGEVPDRSTVPGHRLRRMPRVTRPDPADPPGSRLRPDHRQQDGERGPGDRRSRADATGDRTGVAVVTPA